MLNSASDPTSAMKTMRRRKLAVVAYMLGGLALINTGGCGSKNPPTASNQPVEGTPPSPQFEGPPPPPPLRNPPP
jgi:hypothetical protein